MDKKSLFFGLGVLVFAGAVYYTFMPSSKELEEKEKALGEEISLMLNEIDNHVSTGGLSQALLLTDKCLGLSEKGYKTFKASKDGFSPYRGQTASLFGKKIQILFDMGRFNEAESLVFPNWLTPGDLESARESLCRLYKGKRMYKELQAYSDKILPLISKKAQPGIVLYQLEAAVNLKDEKPTRKALEELLSLEPQKDREMRIEYALRAPLSNKALSPFITAQLKAVAETLKEGEKATFLKQMVIRGLITQKNWKEALANFGEFMIQLDDDPLYMTSRNLYSALRRNGEEALLKKTSGEVMRKCTGKNKSRNLAARQWMDCQIRQNPASVVPCLKEMVSIKLDPDQIGTLFEQYFYDNVKNPAVIGELCSIAKKVLPSCKKATSESIRLKLLDGAFITENYGEAISIIEKGVPGKDKVWHSMSLPKVKAHLALKENRPRDAVKYFREFMGVWTSLEQKEEFDPSTGIAYSKEWILGRNADRIAKILEKIPDAPAAAKAREEAKGYFKKALEKAKNDKQALPLLKQEAASYLK